ncbi:MAG: ribonuclease Z, partial [Bacteroidaceae bacterium]
HEATYDKAKEHKAALRGHSTAEQAATIAKMSEVGRLMIGHYSASIEDVEVLLNEAREVFPSTLAAQEGMVVSV